VGRSGSRRSHVVLVPCAACAESAATCVAPGATVATRWAKIRPTMGRYVALLRGINVGGKNLIKMPALVACFEKLRLEDVATYIQSGNVLFTSSESASRLPARIEAALSAAFGYRASVMLRSRKQMVDVVDSAPQGFGADLSRYRCDVMFLKPGIKPAAVVKDLPLAPGVDQVYAGPGVLYFSRLAAQASRSRLAKVVSMPIYQNMTIRNWNTTTAIFRLINA
jgi:uncharacterized protein (DUF1697 family)